MAYHARMPRPVPPTSPGLFAESEVLKPLAERMRPRSLDEIVGQQRLVGADRALRRALEAGKIHSMVLWGPPGCGKTTLALLVARYADADFRAISAVLSGLPDVRKALAEAELNFAQGRRTVLFVDEVHRFNKTQQDAFLPHIERGVIFFVAATTENPSFELNSALALPWVAACARSASRTCWARPWTSVDVVRSAAPRAPSPPSRRCCWRPAIRWAGFRSRYRSWPAWSRLAASAGCWPRSSSDRSGRNPAPPKAVSMAWLR